MAASSTARKPVPAAKSCCNLAAPAAPRPPCRRPLHRRPPPSRPRRRRPATAADPATETVTQRALRTATPFGYRVRRRAGDLVNRLLRKPRGVSEGPNLLPLLIRVLACFSKLDGKILEDEIDSSLGFLRHDYPEAVYSELRRQFRQALNEQPDLEATAAKLNGQLTPDRKILLGIQLWDLIGRAGQQQEQVARVLQVHVRHRHDRAGHRHRLPAQFLRDHRLRPVPARQLAAGIARLRLRRGDGRRALPGTAARRPALRLTATTT